MLSASGCTPSAACSASRRATVVLPAPGGPVRISALPRSECWPSFLIPYLKGARLYDDAWPGDGLARRPFRQQPIF